MQLAFRRKYGRRYLKQKYEIFLMHMTHIRIFATVWARFNMMFLNFGTAIHMIGLS
jgi:hypothetical protein